MSSLSRISLLQTQFYLKVLFVSQPLIKSMFQQAYRTSLPKYAPLISTGRFFKSDDTKQYFTSNKSSKTSSEKKCDLEAIESIENVTESNELSYKTPKQTSKCFTPEDDQLIVLAVELHGDERNTFVKIAKALDMPDPSEIENRYRNYLINLDLNELKPSVEEGHSNKNRYFQSGDDEVILNHINQYGKSEISMKVLAQILNRRCWKTVRNKANKLTSMLRKEGMSTNVKPNTKAIESKMNCFTFEKPWRRQGRFSSQEDITIVNHIEKFGTSQISLTRLAQALNRDSLPSLMIRHRHLKSKESEKEISSGVLGENDNSKSDLKSFGLEKRIEKRFENGSEKRVRKKRNFTQEEDDMIIQAVEKHGDNRKTFTGISKILCDRPDPRTIETRHRSLITPSTSVKGRFSPEEDQIILQHIAKNGQGRNSLKELADILNRRSCKSLAFRISVLKSTNEYDKGSQVKGEWTLEEDRNMVQNVLSLTGIQSHDIAALESVTPSQFSEFGKSCKRSSRSCYMRWKTVILPAIKTYILGLPLNCEWKLDVMLYTVKHKTKSIKDLELDMLVKEVAPGQTVQSILVFLDSINLEIGKLNRMTNDVPIYELVVEKLDKKSSRNPLFNSNHKQEIRRLERMNAIIDIYRNFIEL